MCQRPYNPNDLKPSEEQYRNRFEQLQHEFGNSYKIFVTNPDGFDLVIGAGVAKLDPETNVPTVVVKLEFCRHDGHELLSPEVIEIIRSHLSSSATEDLLI